MTSVVLTIPDDPAAVPGWLERHLLARDLNRLVAELETVHRPAVTVPVLDDLLGHHALGVLAGGLSGLPRQTLSMLLRHPSLLAELRDRVLIEGGSYWDHYLRTDGFAETGSRVADRVRAAVATSPPTPRQNSFRRVGYAATAFATAAAVLVGVHLAGLRVPVATPGTEIVAGPGWGFQKVKQLPAAATDAQTLTALADLAAEWGKKTPATPAELARRLVEFREGCAAIQLAENLPLSDPNRQWLRLRCGDWAAALDGHLRTLEDTRDTAAVRTAADRTVAGLVAELRARAASPGKT